MPWPSHPRPSTLVQPLTDLLHGVQVTDPYRWLEESESLETRQWIEEQTHYARAYLDNIPGRHRVRNRVAELLTVDTCEIPIRVADRYFFRKRTAVQEQPCIYMRNAAEQHDTLLVDPSTLEGFPYTSVSIARISADARLLLYEIKQGGERSGVFKIIDVDSRQTLADVLQRGILRGFLFDSKGFYYVHEISRAARPHYRAAYHHIFGTTFDTDKEIFFAGEAPNLKLAMTGDNKQLCFVRALIGEKSPTEYYLHDLSTSGAPRLAFCDNGHLYGLSFWEGRIFAVAADNTHRRRIVEMKQDDRERSKWCEVVPACPLLLKSFAICEGKILVQYANNESICIRIFELDGTMLHEASLQNHKTTIFVQLDGSSPKEIFYKQESFTTAPAILRYRPDKREHQVFAQTKSPVDTADVVATRVLYPSHDGTVVPMYLVAKRNLSPVEVRPTILTAYGGFGKSMTPQFGIFTTFLIERGCLFALAGIRGGSEYGEKWHLAAVGPNRQNAFDDFISAAEWLVSNGYTRSEQLAIFGGSNSGLLVGAALTQRPDLFRAVVCLGPLLDMLRYHLFDSARKYRREYGIAEDPEEFAALRAYSPYHHVDERVAYPAVLLVSGDADMNCNPMHARKMTARLQAASTSAYPIILDYKQLRGHLPVMPLSERIDSLTDRLSFVCDQIGVAIHEEKTQIGIGVQ